MGLFGIAVFQLLAFVFTWLVIWGGSKLFTDDIDLFPGALVIAIFVWFVGFIWGTIGLGLLTL